MIFSYRYRPGSEFENEKTTDPDLAKKSKSERNGSANHYAGIAVMILIYLPQVPTRILLGRVDTIECA
jgi:hypothetical protein